MFCARDSLLIESSWVFGIKNAGCEEEKRQHNITETPAAMQEVKKVVGKEKDKKEETAQDAKKTKNVNDTITKSKV